MVTDDSEVLPDWQVFDHPGIEGFDSSTGENDIGSLYEWFTPCELRIH